MNNEKTNNKIKNENEEPEYESYPDISNTVSSTECTGMMYAPPQNQDELESYQELFSMEIPKTKKSDDDQK